MWSLDVFDMITVLINFRVKLWNTQIIFSTPILVVYIAIILFYSLYHFVIFIMYSYFGIKLNTNELQQKVSADKQISSRLY